MNQETLEIIEEIKNRKLRKEYFLIKDLIWYQTKNEEGEIDCRLSFRRYAGRKPDGNKKYDFFDCLTKDWIRTTVENSRFCEYSYTKCNDNSGLLKGVSYGIFGVDKILGKQLCISQLYTLKPQCIAKNIDDNINFRECRSLGVDIISANPNEEIQPQLAFDSNFKYYSIITEFEDPTASTAPQVCLSIDMVKSCISEVGEYFRDTCAEFQYFNANVENPDTIKIRQAKEELCARVADCLTR